MRIVTWNINGLRTLPLYHPWNELKTGERILNELEAEIICFQELKTSRQSIEKRMALPDSYDAFFSFPASKGGYSGVSVYTKTSSVVPLKAEEGLSGCLLSGLKPPLSEQDRISSSYPTTEELQGSLFEDKESNTHKDLCELDREGRAVVLDFGLFVLINVYCPNLTSDSRLPYKMNFQVLLEERVRRLIEIDRREVIVIGDVNICASPADHCDGHLPSVQDGFYDVPARKWFHEWLDPIGPMVDAVRMCWPERKGLYTCWNLKIGARATNYGTRVDYILMTKGLLPWFKHGDIRPSIKGSDHCPVFVDLHDEIVDGSGNKVRLEDKIGMIGGKRLPPRLASRYWSELSGKQRLLSSFFEKKAKDTTTTDAGPSEVLVSPVIPQVMAQDSKESISQSTELHASRVYIEISEHPTESRTQSAGEECSFSSPRSTVTASGTENPLKSERETLSKRRSRQIAATPPSKKARTASNVIEKSKGNDREKSGASRKKISSFFMDPKSLQSCTELEVERKSNASTPNTEDIIDVDEFFTEQIDSATSSSPILSTCTDATPQDGNREKNGHSWSTLFAPIIPPLCNVHNEPTREFTVNKPGPNKGKTFFICSRPVGPGYDAGKDKRLREEVDPQYRCNFFKWSSDVKKETLREVETKGVA